MIELSPCKQRGLRMELLAKNRSAPDGRKLELACATNKPTHESSSTPAFICANEVDACGIILTFVIQAIVNIKFAAVAIKTVRANTAAMRSKEGIEMSIRITIQIYRVNQLKPPWRTMHRKKFSKTRKWAPKSMYLQKCCKILAVILTWTFLLQVICKSHRFCMDFRNRRRWYARTRFHEILVRSYMRMKPLLSIRTQHHSNTAMKYKGCTSTKSSYGSALSTWTM